MLVSVVCSRSCCQYCQADVFISPSVYNQRRHLYLSILSSNQWLILRLTRSIWTSAAWASTKISYILHEVRSAVGSCAIFPVTCVSFLHDGIIWRSHCFQVSFRCPNLRLNSQGVLHSTRSWFVSLSTVAGFASWAAINLTFIRFCKSLRVLIVLRSHVAHCPDHGMKFQGFERRKLVYSNSLQPYLAYWGIFWTMFLTLINGFKIFWDFTAAGFLTSCELGIGS